VDVDRIAEAVQQQFRQALVRKSPGAEIDLVAEVGLRRWGQSDQNDGLVGGEPEDGQFQCDVFYLGR
jgi:hypothetical protein